MRHAKPESRRMGRHSPDAPEIHLLRPGKCSRAYHPMANCTCDPPIIGPPEPDRMVDA